MYDKLQLTNFDFIYDANDRQLKSKRSYSKDGNAVSITKSQCNVSKQVVHSSTKNRVMSVNVDESENVLCSDVL